jgi:hypothetical protein
MTRKTAKEWAKELHDGADIYRKEGRHDLAERQDEVAALLVRLDGQVEAANRLADGLVHGRGYLDNLAAYLKLQEPKT